MKSQVQKQNSLLENNKQEHLLTLNNISTAITDYCQLTVDKFGKEGFNSLTVIQQKALPVITRKINCLLVAPTGSGKTEAAVLPIFAMLSSDQRNYKSKIRAIYITPLRALNNDVLRRIIKYAESENLRIQIRHGDTTTLAKKKILENPPDILITTPESLAVILTIEKMLDALCNLEWIIVDEIHELISNERGAHLSIGLERLQAASLQQVTRIGLSATLGNLDEAAKFIAGTNRKHAVIVDNSVRKYDVDVRFIKGSINDVAHFVVEYVKANRIAGSVLLFTNTRDEAEYIGTILKNQNDIKVDVHHGSLSKDVREDTEVRLREGLVDIVVCTSSLELGLDIGSVELVIHYGSPRQVSKLMQRIGRSRHTQGNSAKGLIVTNNPDDEIEALAIIRRMRRRSIEEQVMHNQALDVVAHHLVGLALQTRSQIRLEDAFDLITKAYPFSKINFYDIEGCIDLLDANRIIKYEREHGSYKRRLKAYKFYFENLSMIPYVLKFEVIDSISNRRIGTLDQQFVGDYGEKGNVFVLKGSQWRVISVDERRMQVNVEPLHGIAINVPYWVGETIPVDYETAEEVGILRNQAAKKVIKLCTSSTIEDTFNCIKVIPDSKNIVIESSTAKNTVIIHSTFGTKVNNTLASILSAILSSQLGYEVETKSDPYRIMLSSSAKIGKGHIESIFNDTYDFEPVIIASLTGTHHINWKVWMVAKRFGMISREAVYDRKVARLIYDRYAKTPISKESIRELLHDKYDIPQTKKVLTDIKNRIIKLHWSDIIEFSSLGEPILEHSGKKFSASPLSIEKGVIELIKERLEKTKHRLICIRCGKWERTMETKETPETISCPTCKSKLITATFWSDNDMAKIIIKRLTGGKLSKDENHKFNRAWKVASLINNFGRKALIVLAGYGIGADTAARILRNYIDDEEIYRSIYEAEKQYVMTHRFWND
jgi:ATP-dependent helicase Lhr and Lhr-like helicase